MKKIIYAVLACIIIAGVIVTMTVGLKADIIYSKNTEIDIYVGKIINEDEIKEIAKQVFPNERIIVQKIEAFDDMVSITIPEKSDEELEEQIEQLNTKINEKYGTTNEVEDITIIHNPKTKLSSIIKPYIAPLAVSAVIILIYVAIRYKKLGILKTILNYVLYTGAVEAIFFSILAITRFSINRLVIPIGLLLGVTVITALGFINEKKLLEEAKKAKGKSK